MNSLRVIACLLGLVVLCQSDCSFQMLEIKDFSHLPTGCVDKDGKEHAFDSEWVTKDCNECSCTEEGMMCCSKIPGSSTVGIPADCEMVVDRAACSCKIVKKSDKTKECNPT